MANNLWKFKIVTKLEKHDETDKSDLEAKKTLVTLVFHQGLERAFTLDDQTFKLAAMFERGQGMMGRDRNGRRINNSGASATAVSMALLTRIASALTASVSRPNATRPAVRSVART